MPIGPVPISLTNLVIYFSLYVLGGQRATITYIVYLLLGLVGLPVFSGFEGGPGKLAGPTGGYLIGFIFMAIVCGLLMRVKKDKKIVNIVFCVVECLLVPRLHMHLVRCGSAIRQEQDLAPQWHFV